MALQLLLATICWLPALAGKPGTGREASYKDVREDVPHVQRDAGAGSSAPGVPDDWAEVLGDGRCKTTGASSSSSAPRWAGEEGWRANGHGRHWSPGWSSSTKADEGKWEDSSDGSWNWQKQDEWKWESWSEPLQPYCFCISSYIHVVRSFVRLFFRSRFPTRS